MDALSRTNPPSRTGARRPTRIGVVGRPGSGKGTQSARIARMLAAPHISTGDLLRAEIEADSPTGQQARAFVESGELVPDPLMLEMLTHRLSQADVLERGFVLDGFPRTVDQAHILGVLLAPETLDVVVELLVPESEAAQRLVARLVCPHCGRAIRGERRSGMCEHCGEVLARRTDDDREVVERRFLLFVTETIPLIEELDRSGRLITVDGNQPVADVTREILAELERAFPTLFS